MDAAESLFARASSALWDAETLLVVVSLVVTIGILLMDRWYARKLIGPPPPPPEKRAFTRDELRTKRGRWGSEVLLGCKGVVYRVDPTHYGPGAGYSVFAGKEVSRHLGKMNVGDEEAFREWHSLTDSERTILDDWEAKFKEKYDVYGWLEDACV
eukprot:gene2965-4660_t